MGRLAPAKPITHWVLNSMRFWFFPSFYMTISFEEAVESVFVQNGSTAPALHPIVIGMEKDDTGKVLLDPDGNNTVITRLLYHHKSPKFESPKCGLPSNTADPKFVNVSRTSLVRELTASMVRKVRGTTCQSRSGRGKSVWRWKASCRVHVWA